MTGDRKTVTCHRMFFVRLLVAGLGNLGTWAWVPGYLGWRWEILMYMLLEAGLGNLGTTLIVHGRFARSARGQ